MATRKHIVTIEVSADLSATELQSKLLTMLKMARDLKLVPFSIETVQVTEQG